MKAFKLREERDTLKALRMEKKKYGWFLSWRKYRHPLARLVKKGIIIEKYGGEYKLTRKKLK